MILGKLLDLAMVTVMYNGTGDKRTFVDELFRNSAEGKRSRTFDKIRQDLTALSKFS